MKSAIFVTRDSPFLHNANKYLCCCGMHALKATKIIGIFDTISTVVNLFSLTFSPHWDILNVWNAIMFFPGLIFLVLLFKGLKEQKAVYLGYYKIVIYIQLVFLAVFTVSFIHAYRNPHDFVGRQITKSISTSFPSLFPDDVDSDFFRHQKRIAMSSFALSMAIAWILNLWFLSIIQKSYRYLNDLGLHKSLHPDSDANI